MMPDRTRVAPTKLAQRVPLLQSSSATTAEAVTALRSDGRRKLQQPYGFAVADLERGRLRDDGLSHTEVVDPSPSRQGGTGAAVC